MSAAAPDLLRFAWEQELEVLEMECIPWAEILSWRRMYDRTCAPARLRLRGGDP